MDELEFLKMYFVFRALNPSRLERFRALNPSKFEDFRALNSSNLAVGF